MGSRPINRIDVHEALASGLSRFLELLREYRQSPGSSSVSYEISTAPGISPTAEAAIEAVLMGECFAGETKVMSIDTNDLARYTHAAERTNPRMVTPGELVSPAVLCLVAQVVRAFKAAGTWTGACGELAADQALPPIRVGLGVCALSMTPAAMPRIKVQIRGLVYEEACRLATRVLDAASAAEVRALAGSLTIVGGR